MTVVIYILLSSALFTAVILIATTASRNANTNLVSLITEAASVIAPLILVAPSLAKKQVQGSKYGLWMAVLAGLFVGLYVLTFNKALSENKVGVVVPVIYGGGIFFSTVLSYFIYKEKVSIAEGIGLALVLAGLLVIIYARAVAK